MVGVRPEVDRADRQLLERFVTRREEEAFAAILERHGPLVLGLCRRLLEHEQDAEDAFQATFLILARKAGSIRKREALAGWLYEVAYRVAVRMRTAAGRQRALERQTTDMPQTDPAAEAAWREVRPILDEELHRLPTKYRSCLVLCYLEGRSNREAARELGWPEGSMSRRLARARELLRARLSRRGVIVSVGVLGTMLPEKTTASVPAVLIAPTLQNALRFAAGQAAAAGAVSAAAGALAEAVLKAGGTAKAKAALVVFLTLTFVGASAGLLTRHFMVAEQSSEPAQAEQKLVKTGGDQARVDGQGDPLLLGAPARRGTTPFRPGDAEPPPAKDRPPEPLPEAIVKAWKDAGAEVGWMRPGSAGFFRSLGLFDLGEEKPGDLPGFLFSEWRQGVLAKLPDPARPFGLWLGGAQVTDAGLKELAGLAGLKNLQMLYLGNTEVTDAGLKELAGLKSLRTLDLLRTKVTDTGLKELAGLKSLETLDLMSTEVTDAGLKELAGLKSLQTLNLWETKVTDAGLRELAGLKSLQALDLGGTEVTGAGLKELAGLKTLKTLNLGDTKVTDAGLKQLAGLKSLQELHLGGTQVTDAGLKELAGLKSLQELDLGSTPVTDAGLKELAGLKSLQELNLGNTQVTDAGLKDLAGLKSLQTLHLTANKVTDAGLKELAGLKSLQTLGLGGTPVTDAGLKELAGLKSLKELSLNGAKVTGRGLKELPGLKSLQKLDLYNTQVTDAGLKELAGLKDLQDLNVGNSKVTDAGLKELAGLKSLHTLALGGLPVTDAGLKQLAGLKSLQTLVLDRTQVTDAGVKELQQALPECEILR
jgi:RNA polymerase sigma factor (sigma-70 family)